MRVLHFHSGNLYGGIETLLLTLARSQHLTPDVQHEFCVCFEGRLSRELATRGALVRIIGDVRVRRPMSVWHGRRSALELLRTRAFDVAVTHSAWSQGLFGPAILAAGLPSVFWLHDTLDGRHWPEWWARRAKPDLVICNSHFTAGTLRFLYPKIVPELIRYPVEPADVAMAREQRAALRSECKAGEDTTVIIQVSRMEPWKGHKLHLRALALLRDLPGWVCWMVGGAQRPHEVSYLAELKRLAAELGIAERVCFLGQRSDVASLLGAADIHCQPNLGPEPFGITFIEGLYARLPVISTSLGGAEEIVDESCGELVPAEDAGALAETLRQLICGPERRRDLGAGGPSRARALCDPATQMRKLGSTLSGLVSTREHFGVVEGNGATL
jgi:glycosyltransferase involved in cell wall biosynthesis